MYNMYSMYRNSYNATHDNQMPWLAQDQVTWELVCMCLDSAADASESALDEIRKKCLQATRQPSVFTNKHKTSLYWNPTDPACSKAAAPEALQPVSKPMEGGVLPVGLSATVSMLITANQAKIDAWPEELEGLSIDTFDEKLTAALAAELKAIDVAKAEAAERARAVTTNL